MASCSTAPYTRLILDVCKTSSSAQCPALGFRADCTDTVLVRNRYKIFFGEVARSACDCECNNIGPSW